MTDHLQVQLQRSIRQWLLSYSGTVHISLREALLIDRYGVVTFADWGGWLIQVMPMLFNERLVLTPEQGSWVMYDYGWCYPRGAGAAYLAALAWDPNIEGEPAGFIKAIHPWSRQPGERAGSAAC